MKFWDRVEMVNEYIELVDQALDDKMTSAQFIEQINFKLKNERNRNDFRVRKRIRQFLMIMRIDPAVNRENDYYIVNSDLIDNESYKHNLNKLKSAFQMTRINWYYYSKWKYVRKNEDRFFKSRGDAIEGIIMLHVMAFICPLMFYIMDLFPSDSVLKVVTIIKIIFLLISIIVIVYGIICFIYRKITKKEVEEKKNEKQLKRGKIFDYMKENIHYAYVKKFDYYSGLFEVYFFIQGLVLMFVTITIYINITC